LYYSHIYTSWTHVYIVTIEFFKDERYNQSLNYTLYAALALLPLKTVIFEELAFRGIIPALILRFKNQKTATIISSLAFGLWHVSTSLGIGAYSSGKNTTVPSFIVIGVVICVTTILGMIFCELRWRSDSLVAPMVVHWFINASAIILASLSWH
jgi:membrane protease YdiL (CAAX protease family)